jgi:hypothetical protein
MISEIMEVPFPLAVSRRLMSFLIFHISMFFSASFCTGADMLRGGVAREQRPRRVLCLLLSVVYVCEGEMRMKGMQGVSYTEKSHRLA